LQAVNTTTWMAINVEKMSKNMIFVHFAGSTHAKNNHFWRSKLYNSFE